MSIHCGSFQIPLISWKLIHIYIDKILIGKFKKLLWLTRKFRQEIKNKMVTGHESSPFPFPDLRKFQEACREFRNNTYHPSLSTALTSAPRSMRNRQTSKCPAQTALWSAVIPSSFAMLTLGIYMKLQEKYAENSRD